MACKPGDITQLTCTGEQICNAVEQTASQAGQLTDHENRITVNANGVLENAIKIAGLDTTILESRVSQNEINIADNETDISSNSSAITINKDDITTNKNDISDIDTRVDSIELTVGLLPTNYASLTGSATQTFEVADPASPAHAINQAWADARYELPGVSYTKAESDDRFLGRLATAIDATRLGSVLASEYVLKTLIANEVNHGIARQATDAEAAAGVVDDCYVTPSQMADYVAAQP